MCGRVIALEKGKIGFDGPTEEGIRYIGYEDDLAVDGLGQEDNELGADV